MFANTSGTCKPTVHVGLHGRVHVFLGANAPSLVGTREEMRELVGLLTAACGMPEPLIEGDILPSNEDIHPLQATA